MHKPKFIQENKMHEIHLTFAIQTTHSISTKKKKKTDLINKKKKTIVQRTIE